MLITFRLLLIILIAYSLPIISYGSELERIFRQGKDFAIFFANDTYESKDWKNLKNPIKDAEAIALELEEIYGFYTQVYKNLKRDEIFKMIS